MSARSPTVNSTSIPLQTLDDPRGNTSLHTSPTLNASFETPHTHPVSTPPTNNDHDKASRHDSANLNSPKQVDESVETSVFPPLPFHYSFLTIQFYRLLSFFLSLAFLTVVVILALFKTLPSIVWVIWSRCQFKDPNRQRPFYHEEKQRKHKNPGKLKCDVAYYAQLQGLSCEEFKVETEDGFILTIQHILDPLHDSKSKRKFPVLMLPGLMQSSGAYCVNDESSLAFFLCKSEYDVWLGNNRGYFRPEHTSLKPSNPKFWAWNLRQMGCLDIPAMVNFVRAQTHTKKIALIGHSQGTALTFLALAKDQVPHLGESLSCFIALAPAVYAGTLLKTFQFSFVKIMSTRLYRAFFGIHSFIPLMMTIHAILPGKVYGWLGYRVFNFLFSWTDLRWERRLRNRFFQFSPVYVSSECMRWWLGRGPLSPTPPHHLPPGLTTDCFAKRKCILSEGRRPWYDAQLMPPVALYVGGRDKLVDGRKLIERFEKVETEVLLLRGQVDEEFEHLDCIWALDCIERVAKNVRRDIWMTVPVHEDVFLPEGCLQEEKGLKIKRDTPS